jgi:hypothetical protein
MGMTEKQSKSSDGDVGQLLAGIESDQRRSDASALVELMSSITGRRPKLWTGGIVGFGRYHYKYASGHEGESCLVGFSPRKAEFSIYLTGVYFPDSASMAAALLAKLGKHRMGKACLYVRGLRDIDCDVLAELVRLSVTRLQQEYGQLPD